MKFIIPIFMIVAALTSTSASADEHAVVVTAQDGTSLHGTLQLPDAAPIAIVLLVQGSGTHVRDQMISGTPTFAEIANSLAGAGIASARFDERGAGETPGPAARDLHARLTDIEDQLAALATMETLQGVPIGVLGHSEGALIAALAANGHNAPDFQVFLSAPTRSGAEVWVDQQMALSLHNEPSMTAERQSQLAGGLEQITTAASLAEADMGAVAEGVRQVFTAWGAPDHAYTDGSVEGFAGAMVRPSMAAFLRFDPAQYLASIATPSLFVYADGDLQTRPAFNLPALLGEVAPSGATTLLVIPGSDHFFLHLPGEAVNVHRFGEMQMSDPMLSAVTGWIRQTVTD